MLLLLIVSYIAIQKKISDKELSRMDEVTIAAISLAIIMQATAYSFGLLGRAICYYSVFEAVLIPEIIQNWFKDESKMIVKMVTVIILIALTIFTQFYQNEYICPFTFVWEM